LIPRLRKQCREVVQSVDANIVQSYLNLLRTFLGSEGIDLKKANLPFPERTVMTYIAFCAIWSLGANLHDASRAAFGEALRSGLKKRFPELPDGDVYDYGVDPELHKLEPWGE